MQHQDAKLGYKVKMQCQDTKPGCKTRMQQKLTQTGASIMAAHLLVGACKVKIQNLNAESGYNIWIQHQDANSGCKIKVQSLP